MSHARPWLPTVLAFAMAIAAVCNGAGFYLKRTGSLDQQAYRAYWAAHCATLDVFQLERQCFAYTTPAEIQASAASTSANPKAESIRFLYQVSGVERAFKVAKDLVWLAILALSCWMLARRRARLPSWGQAGPMIAFAAYSAAALLVSVPVNGALIAAAGLRSFLFLPAAVLGQWLVAHISVFARAAAALLALQVLLLPVELFRGAHLFHEWSPFSLASRVTGTMVHPNSLGVLAVATVAFYYCFSESNARLGWLSLAALGLVLLSGSGTGLVCAALALSVILWQRAGSPRRSWMVAAGLLPVILVVLALPFLSGRADVFDSTGGRMAVLQAALFDRAAAQVALGSGLGVNTNLALNLSGFGTGSPPAPGAPAAMPTDSMFTSLVIQVGLVGTLLFYAMLFWGARRVPAARPFYGVIAVCSLTINVAELFPVNMLLALALAHSAWHARAGPWAADTHA